MSLLVAADPDTNIIDHDIEAMSQLPLISEDIE